MLDVGAELWASPASDPFYVDLALASADAHFASRRPRVRVWGPRSGSRPCALLAWPAGARLRAPMARRGVGCFRVR